MRVAAVLTFVVVAVVAADQAPAPRQSAPSAPTSGAAGVAAPQPSSPQTPSKDPYTAIIRGRVVRADNAQPLAFARVSITYSASDAAIADEDGRFELKGLPAGRYTVTAAKGGFVTRQQGLVTLTAGQTVDRIDFTLQKGGVIAGVVLDESGEPLIAAPVQLYQFRYDNDFGRRLMLIGVDVNGTGGSADTPEVRVVLFAEDETKLGPGTRFWAFRRLDATGLVTVTGLPPAPYLAVAVEDLEPGDETNMEMLRRLRSVATGLALDEGESVTLNLTVRLIPAAR